MTVWDDLVGQQAVVAELRAAAVAAAGVLAGEPGAGMTHAWLLTGPPGSGRSNASRAFAAALQCEKQGCGECDACRTVLAGTHADVRAVSTETLSIGVVQTRELVRRSALTPAGRRWHVIILEDADRLTEQAANVLLKAVEEPSARTVWLLCAPSSEDVLPTIRSRCRQVRLVTPSADAVAEVLVRRDGIDPEVAGAAARAAQGHIGRARRLAMDDAARARRDEVLRIPGSLRDIGACIRAASNLVETAAAEARDTAAELDAIEVDRLRFALGAGPTGRMPPGSAGALRELEDRQKRRAKRIQRDAMDRALIDLAAFYRDVLTRQVDAPVDLVNESAMPDIEALAAESTPEDTVRRIEAVLACREALDTNAHPLLAAEAMMLTLASP
jgi:DNA polymerase III subunit delta'